MVRTSVISLVLVLPLGCGGSGDEGLSGYSDDVEGGTVATSTNDTIATNDTATNDTSSNDTTATATEDGTATGPLFDINGQDNADDGPVVDTCQKVDVLYVIDNSPSMYEEQQTLIANFDTFVTEMQAALVDVDSYHIGVITSDNYIDEGFLDDSTQVVNAGHPECRVLGGLVVESQQGDCTPFAGGDNFITEQDNLGAKFACIANVGEDGDSDERMGTALVNALTLGQQPGGCNGEFIRKDALLIVVLLTDENDSSPTTPQDWFDSVVDAKGTEQNVVMLALTWDSSEFNCNADLSETDGYTIVEFAELFTNHATGNICDDDYSGFFSTSIPTIDSACEMFEPVG